MLFFPHTEFTLFGGGDRHLLPRNIDLHDPLVKPGDDRDQFLADLLSLIEFCHTHVELLGRYKNKMSHRFRWLIAVDNRYCKQEPAIGRPPQVKLKKK